MKKLLSLLIVLVLTMLVAGAVFANGGSEAASVAALTAADGQALVKLGGAGREIPARPADPEALPESDPLHWWDMEFAGWNSDRQYAAESPKDGAIGKKVIMIVHGDHPWTTACINGATKVAEVYDMDFKVLSPNWDLAVQNQMIDQAINERPDILLLIPLDASTAPQQARKINQAGVPLLMFNTLPDTSAIDYCIGWTGPDDFGQQRVLSHLWADELGKKGGVVFTQHNPGTSPYFARYWGPRSELAGYAPEIEVLDAQSPGFDADKTQQLVSDWLTRFGDDLTGICAADDSAQALGISEALKKAGREDIVVVAAGNSKQGMDLVQEGKIFAITYQTAEGDGALAVKTAADWFNGIDIPTITYLPQHMITADDVADFYPPQW